MTTTITRRTALAASATLPLLPVSALATETNADAELIRLGVELDAQWAQQKVLLDSGPLDEALEAALDETYDLVKRIEHIPATTWAGLRTKTRAAMWCHMGCDDREPFRLDDQQTTDIRLVQSIIGDLVGAPKASHRLSWP